EKMYYAQGLTAHLFGAIGSAIGVLLAWAIWRLGVVAIARFTATGNDGPVTTPNAQMPVIAP
ncbi:MAG: hypothetical protein K1X57_20085, partial [Gemmataceae bacterium]|nr:hypothetical protein [Gemmataceae bacterium]